MEGVGQGIVWGKLWEGGTESRQEDDCVSLCGDSLGRQTLTCVGEAIGDRRVSTVEVSVMVFRSVVPFTLGQLGWCHRSSRLSSDSSLTSELDTMLSMLATVALVWGWEWLCNHRNLSKMVSVVTYTCLIASSLPKC